MPVRQPYAGVDFIPSLRDYEFGYQCWGSVIFLCGSGSGSPDPYLWLMDPDPTPFFIDFKDAIKHFFSYVFLITFILQALFQSAQHIYEKKIRIRIRTSDSWIRIQEAQKHADPADPVQDPDPQHCRLLNRYFETTCTVFLTSRIFASWV
jgi:hypothetical protein